MTHQFIMDLKDGMEIQQYFVVRQVEERLNPKRQALS